MADAIAVLQDMVGLAEPDRAQIRIGSLNLRSADIVGLVQVVFDRPDNHKAYVVSLPSSKKFSARRPNMAQREIFDITLLHEAALDSAGNVLLADGTRLSAVEVIPARLPLEPSRLDWPIVHCTLSILKSEGEACYQPLNRDLSSQLRDMVPDLRFIDCSKLRGLSVPTLKEIAFRIREQDPTLKKRSEQQIANSLRKFGIRVPKARPRIRGRHAIAIIKLG